MITLTVFLKTGQTVHMTFGTKEVEYAENALELLESVVKDEFIRNLHFDLTAQGNRYLFKSDDVVAVVCERHANYNKYMGKDGNLNGVVLTGGTFSSFGKSGSLDKKLEVEKGKSQLIHAEAGDVILVDGEKRMVTMTENGVVTETEDLFKYVALQLFDVGGGGSYAERIENLMSHYEVKGES